MRKAIQDAVDRLEQAEGRDGKRRRGAAKVRAAIAAARGGAAGVG
jgi:hypothetical protein